MLLFEIHNHSCCIGLRFLTGAFPPFLLFKEFIYCHIMFRFPSVMSFNYDLSGTFFTYKECLSTQWRLSKAHVQITIDRKNEYIMTNIENEKIIPPPLKLITKSEVMNDLLKLLSLVQKHVDKEGC